MNTSTLHWACGNVTTKPSPCSPYSYSIEHFVGVSRSPPRSRRSLMSRKSCGCRPRRTSRRCSCHCRWYIGSSIICTIHIIPIVDGHVRRLRYAYGQPRHDTTRVKTERLSHLISSPTTTDCMWSSSWRQAASLQQSTDVYVVQWCLQ
jgi:hypothetical protein